MDSVSDPNRLYSDVRRARIVLMRETIGFFLYRTDCFAFAKIRNMPADTEARIHQLCTEVLAAETQADIERISSELRVALEEHIKLAKDSLKAQVTTITALDAATLQELLPD
jgi:predicted DNA-binding ribbon-helix-helix protein